MVWFAVYKGDLTLHELMITIFLFLTAPISAHFIAKANIFRDWPRGQLPPPGGGGNWAVHEVESDTSAEELQEAEEAQKG